MVAIVNAKLTSWGDWLQANPWLAGLIVLVVGVLLALAMWLGLDLSWIPGLLRDLLRGLLGG